MRERLESSEQEIENIEAEAEQVEERMEEIEQAISEIESTINSLESRGDQEAAAALQKNLQEKQQEKEQESARADELARSLDKIQGEINEVNSLNQETRGELSALSAAGEDVSEAMGIVQEREQWVQQQEKTCQELRQRLGRLSGGN